MDKTLTIEPIRWQEEPSKISIYPDNPHPRVYYQVTSPRSIMEMCRGRPVEELPRILSIISAAHHLAAAEALDNLFNVEPPPLALNMRAALLHSQFFSGHLRKLYFLLSFWENPFLDFQTVKRRRRRPLFPHQILDETMYHVALAQEAETILGGRSDHPLSAVAGGVSRFLKDGYYQRLSEIAETCLNFAVRLADFLRENIFSKGIAVDALAQLQLEPMASMSLADQESNVIVADKAGQEMARFPVSQWVDKIGLHTEAWSYLPFAYLKEAKEDKTESNTDRELQIPHSKFFFVGSLARLNRGEALNSPLAEAERQRLIDALGPFPHFGLLAAYWSLLVGVLQAAEKMGELCLQEKLTGPAIRTIPAAIGREGHAALESPQGIIFHHYLVNEKGIVEDVNVIDAAMENNAFRCQIVKNAVSESWSQQKDVAVIKDRVEIGLLPF